MKLFPSHHPIFREATIFSTLKISFSSQQKIPLMYFSNFILLYIDNFKGI